MTYYFFIWIIFSFTGLTYGAETVMTYREEKPKYLYKILSYRNWKASELTKVLQLTSDDDQFIHLAKEDQLENILLKYFSDADQVVILKVVTDQLQGELVYEANPGGSSKYYHLYRGFIPFTSIVEVKICYNKHSCCGGLEIVQMGHPVLRQIARNLSKEEILSSKIQELIQKMQATMRAAPGIGLAAPQIGEPLQLAVIEDMDHGHLTAEMLKERDRHKVPFHVIINPKLFIEDAETAEFFEGCLSIPEFLAVVPRAKAIRVECLNEKAEPVVIHAKGWYARILQHEIDHLNGILYLDRADSSTIMTQTVYNKSLKR